MSADEIIRTIERLKKDLGDIVEGEEENFDLAVKRLVRWEERAFGKIALEISPKEAQRLKNEFVDFDSILDPHVGVGDIAEGYQNHLTVLIEEIKRHPPKEVTAIERAIRFAQASAAQEHMAQSPPAKKTHSKKTYQFL